MDGDFGYCPSKTALAKELWKRNSLKFILKPHQYALYEMFHAKPDENQVWNVSRQYGKSTTLTVLSVEYCWRHPGSYCRFFAPTRAQARDIVEQNMPVVLESCPKDMLPRYLRNQSKFEFPNGSTITLRGTDASGGKGLRGGSAHLVVLDEAAFMADLDNIVGSVIQPMFQNTDGRYIMSSTPPPTMAHPFTRYVEDAIRRKTYISRNFDDNTGLSEARKEKILSDNSILGPDGEILVPARERDSFKREYLCMMINDSTHLIIPEFQAVKHIVVQEQERPLSFIPFVAADWGVKDYDAILFGYVDFEKNSLVVEDEILVNYQAPSETAVQIQDKCREVFPNRHPDSIRFIGDIDWAKTGEIKKQTGITFRPARKHDPDLAIASLRTKISMCGIRINPRCHHLIRQLDQGVWDIAANGRRKEFKRSEQLGHCDLVAALIYMHREAPYSVNPFPIPSGPDPRTHHIPTQPRPTSGGIESMFQRRRR